MSAEDLRKQFKKESGIPWVNNQEEPDIDYVMWLEQKLSQPLPEITDEEIDERAKQVPWTEPISVHQTSKNFGYIIGFRSGAKWYRKQLQK